MKIIKTASGKRTIKISKSEWEGIGRTAGWMKVASSDDPDNPKLKECTYCGREFPREELLELKRGKDWCCDKCLDKYEKETK